MLSVQHMTNDYCCQKLDQLRNDDYVHNGLIYLQRLDVKTDFPNNLRLYNFCTTCGTPANRRHDDINPHCPAFKKGITMEKFGVSTIFDRNANENQYTYNLDRRDKISRVSVAHPNYPEATHLNFCPYCGHIVKG